MYGRGGACLTEKYPLFGAKVRDILRAKNITIEKFSETIGVTENFMSKIISGYAPSFHNFIKIVDALGVSADYLIQDYITAVSDDVINANPVDAIMVKSFSTLTVPQKEEVLRLPNFFNGEKK
jgi:transcriptional regulator with XRE-family HTH domain